MKTAGRAGWLRASLMAAALAGCATTHGGLNSSADRLDRNAQAFAQNSQEAPRGYSENTGYTADARDFADRAHEFRRAVEDEGADSRDVRASFDDLSRSYHALRDDVERSGDRGARHDLQPVTQAYLDVEDNMGGARAPSRYSEEDDDRGPGR
ncbi:MAG: hypothetical protein KGL45_12515 [Gammaproteobacteria bacterium]|nr:hypothetical protein [Gammaproteobacteria bacterium]